MGEPGQDWKQDVEWEAAGREACSFKASPVEETLVISQTKKEDANSISLCHLKPALPLLKVPEDSILELERWPYSSAKEVQFFLLLTFFTFLLRHREPFPILWQETICSFPHLLTLLEDISLSTCLQ